MANNPLTVLIGNRVRKVKTRDPVDLLEKFSLRRRVRPVLQRLTN